MDIALLSKNFIVKKIAQKDLEEVLNLCLTNPMYYQYCPPIPTLKTLENDIKKLPPNTSKENKYYLGFYKENELIAVMDLILFYPNPETALIGFFMMKQDFQGKGIGSLIVQDAFLYLQKWVKNIRLGYVMGNPQSRAFWKKQGFTETGVIATEELYSIVILNKEIGGKSSGY